jgi:hypothetical protein
MERRARRRSGAPSTRAPDTSSPRTSVESGPSSIASSARRGAHAVDAPAIPATRILTSSR